SGRSAAHLEGAEELSALGSTGTCRGFTLGPTDRGHRAQQHDVEGGPGARLLSLLTLRTGIVIQAQVPTAGHTHAQKRRHQYEYRSAAAKPSYHLLPPLRLQCSLEGRMAEVANGPINLQEKRSPDL